MSFAIIGYGLLGKELHSQTKWDYFSKEKDGLDVTSFSNIDKILSNITHSTIINCVGYTNTQDNERNLHWDINVIGTKNLIDFCKKYNKKLVHISTDYIYANSVPNASESDVPVHCDNWYGYSKLVADALVQIELDNYLLLRGTHKSFPFKHKKAWINQIGNFDYVSNIVSLMIKLITNNHTGIYNVGTELKNMYQLALKTNKNILPSICPPSFPKDVSMDLNKLNLTK